MIVMISRRRLLIDTSALALTGGIALCQFEPAFKLDFGDVELESNLPVKVAIDTSGYTSCQVRIQGRDGNIVLRSKEWGTEPNRPESVQSKPVERTGPYRVLAEMRPTAPRKPSMALALHQDPGVDLKRLERMADKVRFLRDPAPRPAGGRFEVDVLAESAVLVRIWQGEARGVSPLYEKRFDDVGPGLNPVPWDLRTSRGSIAPPGRYLANVICTPKDKQRKPTNMFSSFAVA